MMNRSKDLPNRRIGRGSIALCILALGAALSGCGSGDSEVAAATATATATVTETMTTIPDAEPDVADVADETAEDTSFVPKPSDFEIKIRIREKECFGSAGCSIVFQIDPTYNGSESLGDGAYDVTYVVTGGEDSIVNTFQIDAGSASYDEEEWADTRSSGATLKAKVTDVYER